MEAGEYVLPSLPVIVRPAALIASTVRTEEPPARIDVGLAVNITDGAGFGVTVTVVCAVVVPPAPTPVTVYVVVVGGLTAWLPPLLDSAYFEPSEPLIETEVALRTTTVSSEDWDAVTELGLAVTVTTGGGFGVTVTTAVLVTLPPAPVAVAVYVVVTVGVTACVPPISGRV